MAVKIKICGITSLEDAVFARNAGADFLGFILYERSPRYIEPEKIKEIILGLKSSDNRPILVGVFVNDSAESIASILDFCGLDLAQLSGDEPPEFIIQTSSPIYGRSFKGIQPQSSSEATAEAARFQPPVPTQDQPALLIDAYHKTLRGGTGHQADWQIAAELSRLVPQLMLAGGLNPSNVGPAVEIVRPFAVDVSSGVEVKPGIKDPDKVRAFIQAAKSAP